MKYVAVACCFALLLCSTSPSILHAQKKEKKAKLEVMHAASPKLFELMTPEQTGVNFNNLMPTPKEFKPTSRLFTIAGGGTAVGDVNGDGLPDIFQTNFLHGNKLYINKGNWKFAEATDAGVSDTSGFGFGATMVDIDGDGDLDIYVTKYNFEANRLFINDGTGHFVERAKEFGLDHIANGIQTTFFDYDLDGDLDALIIDNGIQKPGHEHHSGAQPRMMRNNGDGTFTDVSDVCGINHKGYGLSATAADINNDGWPDVYIANDFEEKDYLYINRHNGTFSPLPHDSIPHTVMFGMGNDVADFNNDGYMDIYTVDMMPERHERRNMHFESLSTFNSVFDSTQIIQNTMLLNRGNGFFSDIAPMSKLHSTEWSWTPLFADFDNDGWKDAFVTNGLMWDIMDKDFNKFGITNQMLSDMWRERGNMDVTPIVRNIHRTRVQNYLFRNNGDLTFTKTSDEWGMTEPFNSCSAAYADFDLDGDLDLVVGSIDSVTFMYRNMSRENFKTNYLQIRCAGGRKNTQGIGARVEIRAGGITQIQEMAGTRGFASSVEPILHFGLGKATKIDRLRILWPGGSEQILTNVKPNQRITLYERDAAHIKEQKNEENKPLLTANPNGISLNFTQRENDYDDFYSERLLPHKLSTNGPAVATADLDADGRIDVVFGGAEGYPATVFLQKQDGIFTESDQPALKADSKYEDQGILLIDLDGDGDIDMFVASGGNETASDSLELLQNRIYLNDGKGNFRRGSDPPLSLSSASCVIAADFDLDGKQDIFIGGRNVPGKFDLTPKSYLLHNDGGGRFTDVTDLLAQPLTAAGKVTSALWSDYDNDGDPDLIVAGEWMPVKIFRNNQGAFQEVTDNAGLTNYSGFWNSIAGADFDNDGDIDYVAGNLGTNSIYKATPESPLEFFAADFDDNGSMDYLMGYHRADSIYPARLASQLYAHMPTLKGKFPNNSNISNAPLSRIVGKENLDKAVHLQVKTCNSAYLQNNGNGTFSVKPLPIIAQIAPVFGVIAQDFNADGNMDVAICGNFYGPDREQWRYDAGAGLIMLGDGQGDFKPLTIRESGFFAPKEARGIAELPIKNTNGVILIVANNKAAAQVFEKTYQQTDAKVLPVDMAQNYSHAVITLKNGQKRRQEFYCGSGYYSQSAQLLVLPKDVKNVQFYRKNSLQSEVKF